MRQVVGHPFIISESLWVPPNRYEAEGPLIVAAQSSLTGLDVFFWFATNVPGVATPWHEVDVFGADDPGAVSGRGADLPQGLTFRRGLSWSMRSVACKTSGIDECR